MTDSAEIDRPGWARARTLMVALIVAVALAVVAVPGRAMADPADDAGATVGLINDARAAYALAPLAADRELQVLANRQANVMADAGQIFHTQDLGGQLSWGWSRWAENVGYGPSVGWIHGAFMNSPSHAPHILDPSYNYVGVGVAYGSDGSVYVAEVFGTW
ncbi:MAG TPA: CAP domain-containing protein [Acidimicrobiales bacterium]|nr:CAP domain-containing protein [Acidimicrobiales bacterium]